MKYILKSEILLELTIRTGDKIILKELENGDLEVGNVYNAKNGKDNYNLYFKKLKDGKDY